MKSEQEILDEYPIVADIINSESEIARLGGVLARLIVELKNFPGCYYIATTKTGERFGNWCYIGELQFRDDEVLEFLNN